MIWDTDAVFVWCGRWLGRRQGDAGGEPLCFISSLSPGGVRIEGKWRCEVRALVQSP